MFKCRIIFLKDSGIWDIRKGFYLMSIHDDAITFICLGIKSGFPTSISMQLRKLYHTGDENIPSVYLI